MAVAPRRSDQEGVTSASGSPQTSGVSAGAGHRRGVQSALACSSRSPGPASASTPASCACSSEFSSAVPAAPPNFRSTKRRMRSSRCLSSTSRAATHGCSSNLWALACRLSLTRCRARCTASVAGPRRPAARSRARQRSASASFRRARTAAAFKAPAASASEGPGCCRRRAAAGRRAGAAVSATATAAGVVLCTGNVPPGQLLLRRAAAPCRQSLESSPDGLTSPTSWL